MQKIAHKIKHELTRSSLRAAIILSIIIAGSIEAARTPVTRTQHKTNTKRQGIQRPAPPAKIPGDLVSDFTLDGKIPVQHWYMNDTYAPSKPIKFHHSLVNKLIHDAANRKEWYYGKMDRFLYRALDNFTEHVKGKSVAILGSRVPWYESIILHYGGKPTTIEYNKLVSEDPRIKTMTVAEYEQQPIKFDVLVSLSSFEHDGLGRYGDPINPNGDLGAMERCKQMLNPGGILILAVPVGPDCLVWNAHRIYGKIRVPMLLNGWRVLGYFGDSPTIEEDLETHTEVGHYKFQPVFVLEPAHGDKS